MKDLSCLQSEGEFVTGAILNFLGSFEGDSGSFGGVVYERWYCGLSAPMPM